MNKKSREIILLALFILIFISLLLSVSYAYYTFNPDFGKGEGEIGMSLPSCAMVTMSDKNQINLVGDYAVPVKDNRLLSSSSEVLSNYRYSFTLTNNCDKNAEITLVFVPTAESNMPISAVKYLINESDAEITDKTGKFLASEEVKPDETLIQDLRIEKGYELAENVYKMEKVTVPAGTSLNLDAYFWIDYNEGDITGNSNNITMNKIFSGFILASNFEDVGSNLAYCEENNISLFSECLIRSDSNKSLEEANKAIDARTSMLDLNNPEPFQLYKVETRNISNVKFQYEQNQYVIVDEIPYQNGDLTNPKNIIFKNNTSSFNISNVFVGLPEDLVTTEEDKQNNNIKITNLQVSASVTASLYIIYSIEKKDDGYYITSGLELTAVPSEVTLSMPGLYKVPDKYTNGNEDLSYMYRGDVIKNWVKFGTETVWVGYNNANSTGMPREYKTEELCKNSTSSYKYSCTPIEADIYWRIIRINGNGSVRMIYSGNNLEEKLESITDSHTSGTYTGILTNRSKDGNSRTAAYAKAKYNATYDQTYAGYMYNPNLVLKKSTDKILKNPSNESQINLGEFYLRGALSSGLNYYFFNDFDMERDCNEETKTCTLTCTNYDSNLQKGDNCIYTSLEKLALDSNNYTNDKAYGSTSSTVYYKNPYKYVSRTSGQNVDGNIVITSEAFFELLGFGTTNSNAKANSTYGILYGFMSSSKEEADKNIADSNAKKEIDEWYKLNFIDKKDNINNELIIDYIADEGFCNDRGMYSSTSYNAGRRLRINNSPILTCQNKNDEFTVSDANGNGALTYPIGMITGDELYLAGNIYLSSSQNYLSLHSNMITMTPYTVVASYTSMVGNIYNAFTMWMNNLSNYHFSPVINLSKDVLYAGGSGLKGDPYTVKLGS